MSEVVKVMLPEIRRVMPSIIANDIIGVQPMIGPYDTMIFSLKKNYNYILTIGLNKDHYRHFLRLYNKRKRQSVAHIDAAGYTCIVRGRNTLTWSEALGWCQVNLKPGSFINHFDKFWFAYDKDAVLFALQFN